MLGRHYLGAPVVCSSGGRTRPVQQCSAHAQHTAGRAVAVRNVRPLKRCVREICENVRKTVLKCCGCVCVLLSAIRPLHQPSTDGVCLVNFTAARIVTISTELRTATIRYWVYVLLLLYILCTHRYLNIYYCYPIIREILSVAIDF